MRKVFAWVLILVGLVLGIGGLGMGAVNFTLAHGVQSAPHDEVVKLYLAAAGYTVVGGVMVASGVWLRK